MFFLEETQINKIFLQSRSLSKNEIINTELINFLYDLAVYTMENAFPLPLLTTAALMNSVPKSIANI